MKRAIALGVVALVMLAAVAASAQYDPALFSVCPEKDCYVTCPSGDISFCYCISYDGAPLTAPTSEVWLSIECTNGCLYLCPAECLDKCSYLKSGGCHIEAGCGDEYCWFFRMGGCCIEAHIMLHMKTDPTPFFEEWVTIKSPDVDCNGLVNAADESMFMAAMGGVEPCYDLNCDGFVDAADMAIFYAHMGHSCDNWIGTKDSSWGAIKSFYK